MARKKHTPEEDAVVRALHGRLIMTICFIEGVQEFPSGPQMREIVESAAGRGDVRTLRVLVKEVDALTITLAPHERDGLDALLQTRLGASREAERAEMEQGVAAVLRRGSIASEKERQRLEQYADVLEVSNGDPSEIATVRQFLREG